VTILNVNRIAAVSKLRRIFEGSHMKYEKLIEHKKFKQSDYSHTLSQRYPTDVILGYRNNHKIS